MDPLCTYNLGSTVFQFLPYPVSAKHRLITFPSLNQYMTVDYPNLPLLSKGILI